MSRREPDKMITTVNKEGPVETTYVFELGHWEVIQIALALEVYAEKLSDLELPAHVQHTRALGRMFGHEGLYTVTRKEI